MQHVATDEVIRRALRAQICPTCPHRPDGSESLGPLVARGCEDVCTIFVNLESLKSIADQSHGEVLPRFERAIQDSICQRCTATPTAGDYCHENFTRTCPLSIFAPKVLEIIERLSPPSTAKMKIAANSGASGG